MNQYTYTNIKIKNKTIKSLGGESLVKDKTRAL